MKPKIVWFRNDLRVHDHPALAHASADGAPVVPVFIFDGAILRGRHAGSNRNRFLIQSLIDLRTSLRKLGTDLVVRQGKPATVLAQLAQDTHAESISYTRDYSPYAVKRDTEVSRLLTDLRVSIRAFPGRLIVESHNDLKTKASGEPFRVFTPYFRAWQQQQRRVLAPVPAQLVLPSGIDIGAFPSSEDISSPEELSPGALPGGETAGRARLAQFLQNDVASYHLRNDIMAANGTSRLSAYLHFGCISPREIEDMLMPSDGARAWHRQLCWRDFYHYVLMNFPDNATLEFQERFRGLGWGSDRRLLQAWQSGLTGYPIVDAAMRQLNREGWMHNRARLIVGSFLTKDLWLDWRLGETYFMRMLIDGDEANNNGNWQWIASVGVDPAPAFRRLYNPTSQHTKFDPNNEYVRLYVPELHAVPNEYIREPWNMPPDVQSQANCRIGRDYPAPIVDHKIARAEALERFRK